ncbi:chemotaxis protein CheY [Tumebacillus flagellatus]|uniref:Chemotaxis protein CheY n=2 Tax=Tumebacillus flagellatus TaxID=1157490 RepID=A0A074LVR8_9BACL|nr:chemotaxis protein CheY [Tumebacillus flagellatus]
MGNWLSPLIVLVVTLTLLLGLFSLMERMQNELNRERAAKVLIGEACNGLQAVEMTGALLPDLILMDINMPVMNGLDTTREIKIRYPDVKIVVITVSDDVSYLFEALKKGAQGYLLKNLNPQSWVEYLVSVVMDEVPMSRGLATKLLEEFIEVERRPSKKNPLSSRERNILKYVASGYKNRRIAEELSISENTVKNHLKNILQKLHLENRVQLTSYAHEQGWIQKELGEEPR